MRITKKNMRTKSAASGIIYMYVYVSMYMYYVKRWDLYALSIAKYAHI
jgi:hypothetical protein